MLENPRESVREKIEDAVDDVSFRGGIAAVRSDFHRRSNGQARTNPDHPAFDGNGNVATEVEMPEGADEFPGNPPRS